VNRVRSRNHWATTCHQITVNRVRSRNRIVKNRLGLMVNNESLTHLALHTLEQFTRVGMDITIMILPQVHLRKPCYDFCFL
jgi:hypothetical protein